MLGVSVPLICMWDLGAFHGQSTKARPLGCYQRGSILIGHWMLPSAWWMYCTVGISQSVCEGPLLVPYAPCSRN